MALRIAGLVVPNQKRLEIALTYLYGIGLTRSQQALKELKIDSNIRVKDLDDKTADILREYLEKNFRLEGDLRREVMLNVKTLKEMGSWRGNRHSKHLPVRGQRTQTNSRTVRGNVRRTMGSGRRVATKT